MFHSVECPNCGRHFDLFAAAWCEHPERPSKVCPRCDGCFCTLPTYREPRFWKTAPLAFQKEGFDRIFVHYL